MPQHTKAAQSVLAALTAPGGASPGGKFRRTIDPAAQARAAAQAGTVAAMPPMGMGRAGPCLSGAGEAAAAALGAGGRPRPSYSSNPFVYGPANRAYGSRGRIADPSPSGQFRRALADSVRAVTAAKAETAADMALLFTGYGLPPLGDRATRTAAARLASQLGVAPSSTGAAITAWPPRGRGAAAARTGDAGGATSSFGVGYPWRFGMAENPYLFGRLNGGSVGARYDATNPFGPDYTTLMAPPHMVPEGYSRPRPELTFPTESGRIAPDVGGGR